MHAPLLPVDDDPEPLEVEVDPPPDVLPLMVAFGSTNLASTTHAGYSLLHVGVVGSVPLR